MFLTVLIELVAAVALIAVYNKQIVCANSPVLYMCVKVLQLPYTKLICCPAVVASLNNLIARQACILACYKHLAAKDNKGWDSLPSSTDALYNCDLVVIAQLYCLRIASLLRACKDYLSAYYAYYKARLVKVVYIFVQYAIPPLCLPNQLKLGLNNACVFIQRLLTIV